MDTYIASEQPECCRNCGFRTEILREESEGYIHYCERCDYEYIVTDSEHTQEPDTICVAQNAVAIMDTVLNLEILLHDGGDHMKRAHQFIYDTVKDQVSGFTGLYLSYAEAALVFSHCEPDDGESYDWPEAIDTYACRLVDYVKENLSWPDESYQKQMAIEAIKESEH